MLIYKDNHELEVSPDAYKSMYKRLGYQVKGTVKKLDAAPKKEENKPLDVQPKAEENKPLDVQPEAENNKPLDVAPKGNEKDKKSETNENTKK